MVDTNRLKSRMVLAGHNQTTLLAECKRRGYKISKNTLGKKINGLAPMNCDDADMLCDVLNITEPVEKAGIFLAKSVPKVG